MSIKTIFYTIHLAKRAINTQNYTKIYKSSKWDRFCVHFVYVFLSENSQSRDTSGRGQRLLESEGSFFRKVFLRPFSYRFKGRSEKKMVVGGRKKENSATQFECYFVPEKVFSWFVLDFFLTIEFMNCIL